MFSDQNLLISTKICIFLSKFAYFCQNFHFLEEENRRLEESAGQRELDRVKIEAELAALRERQEARKAERAEEEKAWLERQKVEAEKRKAEEVRAEPYIGYNTLPQPGLTPQPLIAPAELTP